MLLNNIIIFQGSYHNIKSIREEINLFMKNKKQSRLYNDKTTKYIKKLKIFDEYERSGLYDLKITFNYTKGNIQDLLNALYFSDVIMAHLCFNENRNIWIVNKHEFIKEFRLIPPFALHKILLDYMQYKESAIILDSFETIKYDRNNLKIVVNDKYLNHDELLDLIYSKTISGKYFIDILEQFINNYYEKCINSYEEIYANTEEKTGSEEPTPFALFFVTFGIIGLIILFLVLMDYL